MLNEQQQRMLQNQAREAQHRQLLISSTPAPRGGITMGTPIGIARREEQPVPSTVAVTTAPAAVRTPVAVPPMKQNSNPSMNPSSTSTSASATSSHQILAPSLSKPLEQPSSSKAASSGNESMSDHISRIISENEVILQGDPVSAEFF